MFCTRNTAAVSYFFIAMLASTVVLGCSGLISASDPGTPIALDNPKIPQSNFNGIDPPTTATATTTPILIPTPTPTPLPNACGAAVSDRSNTGLVADCNALLAARDTLRGTTALNWAGSLPIARWDGVVLGGSPQRVTKVKLNSQKERLDGQIPAEIGDLAMLEELWLHNNRLSGTLPSELGDLSNLSWLFLSNNELSGQIPEDLNKLELDRFWIHKNSFTGCVPYNLTLTREYKVDSGLPACTSARLTAIEGRLDDIERRLAALETAVAGLTGTPTAGGR